MSQKVPNNVLAKPEQAENTAKIPTPAPVSQSFYRFNTATVEQVTAEELLKVGSASKGGGGKGVHSLNICCAENNRKSIKLSKSLYTSLFGEIDEDADPQELYVLKDGTNLIIGSELPGADTPFSFSNPTSMMIYGSLTLLLVKWFGLDFTGGRTSRSFQSIEVVMPEKGGMEKPYAIVDMTRPLRK